MKHILRCLGNCLVILFGLYTLHWPIFGESFGRVHGDFGDSRYVALVMEHTYSALFLGWPDSVFHTAWAFFPIKNTIFYSDNLFGNQPIYAFFRLMGLPVYNAYQAWMLLSSALNYIVMYLYLVRGLRLHRLAAVGAAFFFAFGIFRSYFLNHPQLIPNFYSVAALWALSAYFRDHPSPWRTWLLPIAGLMTGLQCWAGHYNGWYLLFLLMWIAAWVCLRPSRVKYLWGDVLRYPRNWLLGVLTLFCMLAPYVYSYLNVQKILPPKKYAEVLPYLPYPENMLRGAKQSALFGDIYSSVIDATHGPLPDQSWAMFLGFIPSLAIILCTAIMCWHLVRRRRHQVLPEFRISVFCFWLIYLFGVHLPSWLGGAALWKFVFYNIPGGSALRAGARIDILLAIPTAIMLAWLLNRLLEARYRKAGTLVAAFLCAFAIAESRSSNDYTYSIASNERHLATIRQQLLNRPNGQRCRTFYLTRPSNPADAHVDAMWLAFTERIPTLNGYSGNKPPGWNLDDVGLTTSEDLATWLQANGLPYDPEVDCHLVLK